MATLPVSYGDVRVQGDAVAPVARPFELRALPFESVFLYSKKIDNSRLVREADPKAGRACWTAVGAAALLVAMLAGTLAPAAATKLAGYRLETLHSEERRLLEERRMLELQEASLLDPARMERLARDQKLTAPAAGQMVHLDNSGGDKVAMVK